MMFGLTIWHAICIVLTLLWLITAYRLHVSKYQRFDARGLPIVDKIRPMPKVASKSTAVDTSKCILIVGGPGEGGSTGGTGGDSGSC
jgi:hypothetical protein